MTLSARAAAIKAVILDVDGVLTDGRVGYGATETYKFFDIRDGHMIRMALRAGLLVGILSGRKDPANRRRAEELEMSFILEGQHDKRVAFEGLLRAHQLAANECLYVGDDVVDLPVMRRVGVAVCVADAPAEVAAHAHWRTTAPGGRGAVRETLVWLLKEQGRWDEAMARYLA